MLRQVSSSNSSFKSENHGVVQNGFQIASIDIDIFDVDYLKLPLFRDLFAAEINNSRLSKVEKLFHLNAKTSGEQNILFQKLL